MFLAPHFNVEPANHPQQPQRGAGPGLKGAHRPFARGQKKSGAQHQEEREVHIEGNIENERAKGNHSTLLNMRMSAMREVTRQINVAMIGTLSRTP